jgi:hypothetical protein
MSEDDDIRNLFRSLSNELGHEKEVGQIEAVECLEMMTGVVIPVMRLVEQEFRSNNRITFDESKTTVSVLRSKGRRDFIQFQCRGSEFRIESIVDGKQRGGVGTLDMSQVTKPFVAKYIHKFLEDSLKATVEDQ